MLISWSTRCSSGYGSHDATDPGRRPLTAVRFVLIYLSSRPHRLAARTWPSQGQNTGSIPVGAIPTGPHPYDWRPRKAATKETWWVWPSWRPPSEPRKIAAHTPFRNFGPPATCTDRVVTRTDTPLKGAIGTFGDLWEEDPRLNLYRNRRRCDWSRGCQSALHSSNCALPQTVIEQSQLD